MSDIVLPDPPVDVPNYPGPVREKQFELLPTEDAQAGFVFGIGAEVSVNGEGFKPGSADWITQDSQNTRRGVVGFGRDVAAGPMWSWESHVDRATVEEAADTLERFATAWRADTIARTPSAVTALRYMMAGRVRRVYGRPRRFDAPPTNLIDSGYVDVGHEFQCVDAQTYADEISTVTMTLAGGHRGGGFMLPTIVPIATLPPADSGDRGQGVVAGTARAYPIIRFQGPWARPTLSCRDWRLELRTTLSETDYIEIDTRPWRLTALKNGNVSVANLLGRRTWLEDIFLAPGSRPEFAIDGNSNTSGGICTVTWRDAYNSI